MKSGKHFSTGRRRGLRPWRRRWPHPRASQRPTTQSDGYALTEEPLVPMEATAEAAPADGQQSLGSDVTTNKSETVATDEVAPTPPAAPRKFIEPRTGDDSLPGQVSSSSPCSSEDTGA